MPVNLFNPFSALFCEENNCEAPPIPAMPSPLGECNKINTISKNAVIICILQKNFNICYFFSFFLEMKCARFEFNLILSKVYSLAGLFGSAQDNMRFWSVGFALHFNKSSAHIFLGNKKDTARKTLMQCHFSCSFFQEWKVDRFLCQPRKPIGFGAAPCGLSEGRLGTFAQRTNIQLCGHIPLSNYIILRVE